MTTVHSLLGHFLATPRPLSVPFSSFVGGIQLWHGNCLLLGERIWFGPWEGERGDMGSWRRELIGLLARWVREEEGQSVAEYSLLLTMIAATFVLVATMMGINVIRLVQHSSTVTIDSSPVTRWRLDQP